MRIVMGQHRQTPDILMEHEEQDRHAAGYIDKPEDESYLPSSVHGSPRHMTALARNALILVSEFGFPHVFITLTCNPKWPEICSQLLTGQTAFDHPDVTGAVFKSRLDQMKTTTKPGTSGAPSHLRLGYGCQDNILLWKPLWRVLLFGH